MLVHGDNMLEKHTVVCDLVSVRFWHPVQVVNFMKNPIGVIIIGSNAQAIIVFKYV